MVRLAQLKLRDYQQELINNTRHALANGSRSPLVTLGCGGGKTVIFAYMAEESQRKGNTVWFLVHRRELLDQTIDTFDRFGINRETIYIDMVNTVSRRLDNLHIPSPDLIIFDEAHFSAAKTWQRIIDKFPKAYIIGLTATPTRLDGKPLGNIYDELVNGESIGSLIDKGYLADYKYYAPKLLDVSNLTKKRGDYDMQQAEELLSTKAIYGDVIEHYKKYADGKKTVVYCSTINHSKQVAQAFADAGYRAVHFDGDTPKKERTEIIKKFRNSEIEILCNVDLISVGFDMPDIDCVVLLRPTDSTALYIQQAARALRYREGKTAIILDHVGNYERHGLPDDEHEWSLDGKFKAKSNTSDDGMLIVRQCETCFAVYESKLKVCPQCGTAMQVTEQELKNIKEIELEEIKRKQKEKADEIVLDFDTPNDCKSLQELQAYARRKGYKNGWAWHIAKTRGFIK